MISPAREEGRGVGGEENYAFSHISKLIFYDREILELQSCNLGILNGNKTLYIYSYSEVMNV